MFQNSIKRALVVVKYRTSVVGSNEAAGKRGNQWTSGSAIVNRSLLRAEVALRLSSLATLLVDVVPNAAIGVRVTRSGWAMAAEPPLRVLQGSTQPDLEPSTSD
jgi:hypothetical protein